jgi:methionine-S-sulfoxide reductase
MKQECAILGGGCFWGVQEILRKIPGVLETEVGYCGGSSVRPTYKDVCKGTTNHAEVVKVTFDPARLSYEELLNYFFRLHDPTSINRQHNDVGTQYRSVIFYQSEEQKVAAEKVKEQMNASGRFKNPIVTHIVPNMPYFAAEPEHQDYLQKNPEGYNCHILRD